MVRLGSSNHILIIDLILLLALFLLLRSAETIEAKEMYVDFIPGPLNGKCEACHSGKSLDVYGEDFGSVSYHNSDPQGAITFIADLDSDGDGYINSVELNEGTFPGDASSYPKGSNNDEFQIYPIAILSLLFLFMTVIVLIYNKGYISIRKEKGNGDGKKNKKDMRVISIADDRKNQGLKVALRNLDRDYKKGTLNEEIYNELKRIYKNKLYD
jgi:hypothetical protein